MQRKYGFTLIEVVVVLLVIGTALSTIIASISGTIGYLSAIKQRTIAMSMAREGIEAIYSIRNTNWRRWSSQKDDCRLNIDPLGSSDCSTTFSEGAIGVVVPVFSGEKTPTQNVSDQNTYHRFEPNNVEEIKQKLSQKDIDQDTSIYRVVEEKGTPFLLHAVEGDRKPESVFTTLSSGDQEKEVKDHGKFYRIIRILSLKDKSNPPSGAKELHFCSTVVYTRPKQGVVNICALMTNFLE